MSDTNQRLIGLTGGIGTGKTTVSQYLAKTYKLPILDADIYAREAVRLGSSILAEIIDRYKDSSNIQLPDGNLNRKLLGEIIFNNPEEKNWLEGKIHPYVRDRFQITIQELKTDTVILAIPLLFEANMADLPTEIWVVYCSYAQQLKRLMQRDRLSKKQAQVRIKSQLSMETKIAAADVILDNSSTLDILIQQIDNAIVPLRGIQNSKFKIQNY